MQSDEVIPVPPKRRRGSRIRWTAAKKEMFFAHLSIAGSITSAAAAIGALPGSVHYLRTHDPDFADAWEAAIEAGYATMEMRLIGHVLAGLGRDDPMEAVGDVASIDVNLAMRLLKERDSRRIGARLRGAARPRRATAAETDALILKKLAAIANRKSGA